MGKVLIKCIQTPMQKYFYDRSLDSVVMVNDEEYQILKTVEKTKLVPDGVLRRFVKSGLLRETAIEEIEHPETENLHLLAEHYMYCWIRACYRKFTLFFRCILFVFY